MWNILHLSAFLLVVPTIFYQCTDNASGTLRQFSDLQQYLSESEKGGGGSDLITLLSREGREVSIDLIHAPWPPLTHHYTAAPFLRIIEIFVGEWEGGRGQWPNYYALPGRERSKYWFNSRTVTNSDSSFYGRRVNPTEKRGLTPNIVLCTHIRLILYFNAGRHSLKGD
jgi:hypothetical protein